MVALNSTMLAALRGQLAGSQGAGTPKRSTLAQQPRTNETSLVGNRQLPTDGRSITPLPGIRGGYDVSYGGGSVGQLLRGGSNGRFVGNGNPVPSVLNSQQPGMMPGGGMSPQRGMPMQLGGGMQGGGMPPRQYAPNPFQQQMMQAQMMRKPPTSVAAPPLTGGVGYDPNG